MLCTIDVKAKLIQNLVAIMYVSTGIIMNFTTSYNSVGKSSALYDNTNFECKPSLKWVKRQCYILSVKKQLCSLNSKMNIHVYWGLYGKKDYLSKSAFALLNHFLIIKTDWAIYFPHYSSYLQQHSGRLLPGVIEYFKNTT